MASTDGAVHYVRRNFDEAAILGVAAKVAFEDSSIYSDSELATLAAMQRAHPQAGDTPEALGEWLADMDEEQIDGVVSNTKGVLHEMEFVRVENEDGDTVRSAMFESTNHEGYDVTFVDSDTGAQWEAQLKSTEDAGYVHEWMKAHPDGEILVTDELADELDIQGSGQSNEALTARTEDLVDRLVEAGEDDGIWDYVPGMAAASAAYVVWELWRRYQRGEITFHQFKWMAARATGLKAGKIALLSAAMMVPGLNVVTGAALVAKMIVSGATLAKGISAGGGTRRSGVTRSVAELG